MRNAMSPHPCPRSPKRFTEPLKSGCRLRGASVRVPIFTRIPCDRAKSRLPNRALKVAIDYTETVGCSASVVEARVAA